MPKCDGARARASARPHYAAELFFIFYRVPRYRLDAPSARMQISARGFSALLRDGTA